MERHILTYLTTVVASLLAAMSLAVSDADAAPAEKQPADVSIVNPESMPVPTYDVDELPRDSRFSIAWLLGPNCVGNPGYSLTCGTFTNESGVWQVPVGKEFHVTAIDAVLIIPADLVDRVRMKVTQFHTDEEVQDNFAGWQIYIPDYTCGGHPGDGCAAIWHLDIDLTWVSERAFYILLEAPFPTDPNHEWAGSTIRASGYLVDE